MLLIFLLLVSPFVQTTSQPLPELQSFLADFRKTLHTDELLLSQYTYTEKRTHVELASNGKANSTETDVYQITRGSDGAVYRQMISKNGAPVKGLKPEKTNHTARDEDEKVIDDLFAIYDMRMVGREDLNGRPAIRIRFTPRPAYKPKTRQGRIMSHVSGDAWIDETDQQLAQLDAEATDAISIGFGLLAKLQKGARVRGERRKVNDEVWLPSRTEVSLTVRVLLVKGLRLREIREYSDYKKFNVETIINTQ
jgi:hypothetical protein